MDIGQLQTTTTRRGYVYSYYYKPSTKGKPTLLFLHGFPSTHRSWSAQITHFTQGGYGVIAPDLLGYGKTSAPNDAGEYKVQAMSNDIIDILNDLKVTKVIAVGHNWGSVLLARLLNAQIDYFIGAAFLALPHVPPQPNYEYKTEISRMNKLYGYDIFGYWEFFAADDAVALSEKNINSFYSLLFPDDPLVWRTDLTPLGKAREWIEQNKQRPRAAFWTEEEQEAHKTALLQKGLRGPYNWYKARVLGLNNADEQSIPLETYKVSIPTFFGGAMKDYIWVIEGAKALMSEFCSNVTTKDFDTSHWIIEEAPDELNEALETFFVTLTST